MAERFKPTIIVKDFQSTPDGVFVNGKPVGLSPEKLEEMREFAEQHSVDFCDISTDVRVCFVANETSELLVDALESDLKTKKLRVDRQTLDRTLQSEITLPGVAGTINDILSDPEKTQSAIIDATDAYKVFYDQVGRLSKEDQERTLEDNKSQMFAYAGVLKRANQGNYNGYTDIMKPIAQKTLGEYLVTGELLSQQVENPRHFASHKPREGVIFTK